jgi:hypothetical protein
LNVIVYREFGESVSAGYRVGIKASPGRWFRIGGFNAGGKRNEEALQRRSLFEGGIGAKAPRISIF